MTKSLSPNPSIQSDPKNSKVTIWILMLIMLVNALSYGTIIPLLYPYAARFGITAVSLGFLFASFSLFQLLATPLIGRLSDRYGRKPLLLLSLLGTSASLALFASAWSAPVLFIARILDGITGGNISVAQAVIADTTPPKDRPKQFGLLGAAFGFGFLFGPAIGGLLSEISLSAPFWFAAGLALVGVIVGIFVLPETRRSHDIRVQSTEKLIDLKKLWTALFTPLTGILLFITLVTATATNTFIIGFQSTTVDVLKLSPREIGLIFTAFGLANVIMQGFGIGWLLKLTTPRKLLQRVLVISVLILLGLGFTNTLQAFLLVLGLYMFIPPVAPIISGLISQRARSEDQGGVLGLSQSYVSLGQIVGPILAGVVIRWYVPASFWLAAMMMLLGAWLSFRVVPISGKKTDL